MSRKLLIKLSLYSLISIAAISFGGQAKASADTWCGVLAPPNKISSPQQNSDCITYGQSYTAFTSLSGSSDQLKAQFIDKMVNFESSKIDYLRLGATYIENMIGNPRMSWDVRLMQPDITLSIDNNYDYSYNSAYDTVNNKIVVYKQLLKDKTLVFRASGVIYLVIKVDCGNPVDVPTLHGIPALPYIDGHKVTNDNSGNLYGPVSTDKITATWRTRSKSDNSQPFKFFISRPSDVTVTAADAIRDWKVKRYDVLTCNLNGGCSSTAIPPGFDNKILFLPAKYDYEYHITYTYAYEAIKPAVITGYKVDTSGNPIGPFSSDSISATSAGMSTDASMSNPYSLPVTPGDIAVTASNNVDVINNKKWTLVGYTPWCDTLTSGCINSPANTKPTIASSTAKIPSAISGHTYVVNWVYDSPILPPQDPKIDCPPFLDPTVTVSLPNQSPSSGAPTGPASSPNFTYNQYTSLGTTKVTGVQDISSGGNRVIPILKSPALNVVQASNKATLDYTPYAKAYPYDFNQPAVKYTNYYTVTPYLSSSTPTSYTCADGSTPNANHICTSATFSGGLHTTTGTPTTTYCTQGGTWNGTDCGSYTSPTPTYTYTCVYGGQPVGTTCSYPATGTSTTGCWFGNELWTGYTSKLCRMDGGTWTTKTLYSCPKGGSLIGSTCYYSATQTAVYSQISYPSPASTTTYTCTYPYTGGGTSSVCSYYDGKTTYTYSPATPWYDYTVQPSYQASKDSTASGTIMPACFDRGFSVTSVNSASANVSFNDSGNENPSSSTPSGYTTTIKFSYTNRKPEQGLRQIMKAKLQYSYKFYKNSNPNSATTCASNNNSFIVTGNSNLSIGDGATTPDPFIVPSNPCSVSVGLAASQLAPGDKICAIYTISPTGSRVDIQGNVTSNGGIVSSTEKCSSQIVNKPYFKVFGGDVSVGGSFANGMSCGLGVANAGIFGWNTANNSVYAGHPNTGAGAQFAISSLNYSSLFASNQNNPNAGTPQSPLGLSFANVGASGNNFGTSFGSANCIPDYYSSKPAGATPISSTSLSGSNGTYYSAGNLTINPSNIVIGNHITIYVAGNVYIKGDINFNNNYSSINDIQSLVIISKSGNIYIDKSVKLLNGIFIAQPSSTSSADGYIYDCAESGFSTIANSRIYDDCDTQLTINGSFIANKVFLNRTGDAAKKLTSSLRGSFNGETNSNTNATEIFNYGPAFWMNLALPQSTSTGSSSAGYDSIISLPPIL